MVLLGLFDGSKLFGQTAMGWPDQSAEIQMVEGAMSQQGDATR